MTTLRAFDEKLPGEIDTRSAARLREILVGVIDENAEQTNIQLGLENGEVATVALTHGIAQTFLDVLRLISSGRGFQIIPYSAELTTQQAADFLNVSRPHLIGLLEQNKIPFGLVGTHRRIRADDLFEHKAKREAARTRALDEIAAIDRDAGLL